ncbi:putative ribosomal protein L35 [Lupinus albus]|uniref:Putative ribosomal protein L35 n=1 Tax=Lupinus albus TaxID=3870 RepID=A0A6A4QJ62_LUPAL|nr:putative ribosomal protein L35 [Lupinus albus]
MQRCAIKLRSFAVHYSRQSLPTPTPRRFFHHAPPLRFINPLASTNLTSRPIFNFSSLSPSSFRPSSFPTSLLVQVRHVSSRERKKRRKPMTPVTSKLKKTKMKSYSSFKLRFRVMNDGNIRRWKEGKRHNAHLKSKKSKRRLRKPGIVPAAYAKVMKKLNFCG